MKKSERLFLIIALVLAMNIAFMGHALAYIDPSVTTYAIQAIVGVVVAVGAVAAIWWRKAKKKVSQKLGIDENAKKTTEADVVEDEDDDD